MRAVTDIDLSSLPVTHQAVIPVSYLDMMGHMNVAWYTHLFGEATLEFYDQFGLNRAYMQANETGVFALEAHIRYVSEVRVDQHVTIRSRAVARTAKRFHFMNFMSNDETGALSAYCEFVSAHIDMKARRMSPILEPVASGFDRFLAEHSRLDWDSPVCGSMRP